MIRMSRQLRLQPVRADRWRILVARAMRYERIVRNIQPELTVRAVLVYLKRIFAHQRHRLESHVFHGDFGVHFTPVVVVARSPPASFTRILRPRTSIPFSSSIARSASSSDPNSTNPNPRERPPSRSQITRAAVTPNPLAVNSWCSSSFVISAETCPTYSFVIRFPLITVSILD